MDGVIQGGWNYVWAAYGVGWGILLLYTGRTLWVRCRGTAEESQP